ncbi:MAG: ABC transporter permease [Synergistaceae bacterium]|nr:ABC transporter permease [Synergistaceae bacterium]MBQ4402171.1 ABC transporter permease [Synergistaceae bacterium]MBQ6666131.1 ABC transporter permease [Synergistaceae bacterium]MBQ6980835.1 ABC transporter permease [Synergistaceae bacterium]
MIRRFIQNAGWPRIIIALFLLGLFIAAPFVGVRVDTSLSNTLVRFGMNGVMVLAMIPMVQAGCGLNFGLPLGIIAGLLGATLSIEWNTEILAWLSGLGTQYKISWLNDIFVTTWREPLGFASAIIIAIPIAAILGWFYGKLLNRVKGDEMMIATYVGFSSVSFMCIAWLLLPYKHPTMVWGYAGKGLRTTISVEGYWLHVLSDALALDINTENIHLYIPTGMLIFFAVMAVLVWIFMRTKTGTAMTAVGSNPEFARASGVNVDRMRTISVMLSTILGAIGIIVYEQSFGFIQLYMGPFYMALPAVASILLGGASVNKAGILNVIVGTFLFQGILTMTPSVINSYLQTDMSEVIRLIVSNGMILYALTRKVRAGR